MTQPQEQRHVYYDSDLGIEAYNLSGIVQKFPNHFHDYYVIGFIEGGRRHLWCRDAEYDLARGDLILFNPRDCHRCSPISGEILDYRAVNIPADVMRNAMRDMTGEEFAPRFSQAIVFQSELTESLAALYDSIVSDAPALEKEETFFFLLEQVLAEYCAPGPDTAAAPTDCKLRLVQDYLEEHFDENVALDQLTALSGLSKSYLLHSFTKQTGVSPYRYLQSIRIEKAKKWLEQGCAPVDAAGMAGFADQSHFTRFFKDFIGLTPKQYQKIFLGKTRPDAAGKSGTGKQKAEVVSIGAI